MKLKTKQMALGIGMSFAMVMVGIMLPFVVLAAGPIETDRDISYSILYIDDGNAISDADFEIYRCANVDEYGQMVVTDSFASYPIDFDGLDQDGWQELATTLKGYAQRDNLSAVESGKTDKNGDLSFALKAGLYLVVGKQKIIGNHTYTPAPFLVFLPGNSETENVWDYEVTSSVKFSKKYNKPDNPSADNTITCKALKIWDDYGYENSRPKEITVQLLRDGKVYDTQTLKSDNNWRYSWSNLSDKFEWTVVEKELNGYTTKVMQEGITFTITNKYDVSLIKEDPPVAKRITGDTPSSSSTFSFVLTAADTNCPMPEGSTGTSKEITIKGSGSSEFGPITFTKSGTYTYTVSEKDTKVEGYTYDTTIYKIQYTVTEKDGKLISQRVITDTNGKEVDSPVFTNKYTTPELKKSSLPKTGMTWWPVPLFICLGLGFYVVGLSWKRKQREDE